MWTAPEVSDTALDVARAWPHDQLAEDARREAASAAIRPRRQPGQAARSPERRVGM